MPHRFAALALAGAVGLTLAASVPAWGEDLPIRGSDACTVAVDADPAVVAAVAALDNANGLLALLTATASLEDRTKATEVVNAADAALVQARAAAELELCVDLPVDTTDPEPTPTTEPPVDTTDPTPTPEPTTTAPTTVVTQINGDVTVNPKADDGSVADTSGTQVTVVPDGSAQTGEA